LVLSDFPTTTEGISVLKAGAKGYCGRNISTALFKKTIKTVLRNELWAGHKIVTQLVEEMIVHSRHEMLAARAPAPVNGLSARKRQIADLVIQGETNKQIASRLDISEATVKSHLTGIFRRLQLSGRLQLALLSKAKTVTK
jgi:DNA-binding NarL/FixJ family response regulator